MQVRNHLNRQSKFGQIANEGPRFWSANRPNLSLIDPAITLTRQRILNAVNQLRNFKYRIFNKCCTSYNNGVRKMYSANKVRNLNVGLF